MWISMKTKMLPLLALTLIVSALFLMGRETAYASDLSEGYPLSVDEVWLEGDILNISVTDNISGESQTLGLILNDYAQPGDEYVTIQATDSSGRTSAPFQFRNPYYNPDADPQQPGDGGLEDGDNVSGTLETDSNASAVHDDDGMNPFTPDGTGTVVDNATDGDGKEFFTVETPAGNIFHLVIDRQRNNDNVYLLNAVTEQDLMALAEPGDISANTAPPVPPITPEPEPQVQEEPAMPAPPTEKGGGSSSLVLILIAVIAVGGAGYYFKIVRPKQNAGMDDDDYDDEPEGFDDDTEVDVENSDEEDELE